MPKHTSYDVSDVEVVLRRGKWQSWDEAINWLRGQGKADNELRADEVDHMVDDFERAKEGGAEFTNDPQQVYEALTSHAG